MKIKKNLMKNRKKVGNILICLGILLVILGMTLLIYNVHVGEAAAEKCRIKAEEIKTYIKSAKTNDSIGTVEAATVGDASYIGLLEIPSIDMELPISSECSEELLKTMPCRYSGTLDNGTLVVAGHNYKDGQFGELSNIDVGDDVYIIDIRGRRHSYTVEEIEILEASDIQKMIKSDWSLTLYTCTYGGQQRLTVRCSEGH